MDATASDTLPPGTPLLQGQFLVEGFLNAGGFGITYLARDSLERRVVLKECFPSTLCCRTLDFVRARSHSQQAEFDAIVRLFGQEARRLAKLDHPNIVGVRDVFEENGTAYMALDYVEGRDLADIVEQEPERLGPAEITAITLKLLHAIDHVHGMGMLHRDISPDNILLRPDDTPVLIDFGAARDTARRKSRVLSSLHVVKDGYSPQEFYLQNGEQSPASDLYALAASLYHLVSGEAPVYSHMRLASIAEGGTDPYTPLVGPRGPRVAGYDAAFLAAIDRTLAVFARDRLQGARDWIDVIEGRAARPHEADETILVRIRDLVESTNVEVRQVQERMAREKAERARAEAEAKAAAEEARRRRMEAARREAEEFAQEMRDRAAERARSQEASATAEPEASRAATTPLPPMEAPRAERPATAAAPDVSGMGGGAGKDIRGQQGAEGAALSPAEQAGCWRTQGAGQIGAARGKGDAGPLDPARQAQAWRADGAGASAEDETSGEGDGGAAPVRSRARGLLGFAFGGRRGRQSA